MVEEDGGGGCALSFALPTKISPTQKAIKVTLRAERAGIDFRSTSSDRANLKHIAIGISVLMFVLAKSTSIKLSLGLY
jgi:hypothetical protein